MSAKHEELRQAMRGLTRPDFSAMVATVKEVDRTALTCDVEPVGGGAAIFNVRLRAATDGGRGGLVLVPAIDSAVVVATINNDWNSAYVAMVSDVDLVTLKTTKESLKQWQKDFLDAIGRMVFATNAGPTVQLVNASDFTTLAARLDNLFLD